MSGFLLHYSHLMFTHIFQPKPERFWMKDYKECKCPQNQPSQQKQAKFYFFQNRFLLFILQDREGERRISFPWINFYLPPLPWPCKPPLHLSVFHLCSHNVPLGENMWEWSITVCKIGCFCSSSVFLCFTACTAISLISLDFNTSRGLDLSLYLYLAEHWEHCSHFANTCHKYI